MYQNGHPQPSTRQHQSSHEKETVSVVGTPSVTIQGDLLVVGDASSSSSRSWTPLKVVGDGSFGTVWLCDWHTPLPPNTPPAAMQCGAGARPEWSGKRLVALKRMKRRWEGGWDECRRLKELESLRAIKPHPNVIPLYDFFLLPTTRELYFVFESMEGNLYQLIKSRKGRPLAGGLVLSIFRQVVGGLAHIHSAGYFHRDMKPENLLVTTTGLADYPLMSPVAYRGTAPDKDVVVIVKLADFGLARETSSAPPYTEYVSTRWYRAPEVLLHSRDYSNPVDMWALGTIMAELVNLKPLFPGQTEIEQVRRITDILGDPSDEYGYDSRGRQRGGGRWDRGVRLAEKVGYVFPKTTPVSFRRLFDPSVPPVLVDCISDLLKYDPAARLTSQQCLCHPYLSLPLSPSDLPPQLTISTSVSPSLPVGKKPVSSSRSSPSLNGINSISPRSIPPSHSYPSPHLDIINPSSYLQPPSASATSSNGGPSHSRLNGFAQTNGGPRSDYSRASTAADLAEHFRDLDMPNHDDPHHMYRVRGPSPTASSVYTAGGDRVAASLSQNGGDQAWEAMDVTPYTQSTVYGYSDGVQPMDVHPSPVVRSQSDEDLPKAIASDGHSQASRNSSSATTTQKSGKFGGLSFGGKKSKWGLASMFGHHEKIHQQNPLPPVDELNVASSSSTPSLKRTQSSSTDSRSLPEMSPTGPTPSVVVTPILDPKQVKEEAKRVQKEAEKQRRIMLQKKQRDQARAVMQKRSLVLQQTGTMTDLDWIDRKRTGVERTEKGKQPMYSYSSTIDAAGARFGGEGNPEPSRRNPDQDEHRHKARRRDLDDDHSIGSSDVQSSRVSMISFATVDSDPGPRLRNRPSAYAITRATSVSSLRSSSGRSFSPSARSSNSLEQQLISEFNERATFAGPTASPPPMNGLSLSPTSGHWQGMNEGSYSNSGYHTNGHPHLTLPPLSSLNQHQLRAPGPGSPYELGTSSHPSSPGLGPPSVINPMFQVPMHPDAQSKSHPSLPPFSQLESVADQQLVSPMMTGHPPPMPDPPG